MSVLLFERTMYRTQQAVPAATLCPKAVNCYFASGYLSTNGDLYPCSCAIGGPDSHRLVVGNVRYPGFDLETAWGTALKKYQTNSCAKCPTALLNHIESRARACA